MTPFLKTYEKDSEPPAPPEQSGWMTAIAEAMTQIASAMETIAEQLEVAEREVSELEYRQMRANSPVSRSSNTLFWSPRDGVHPPYPTRYQG